MQKAKLITIVVLAIIAVIIIVQNLETVDTKLLFITISMPRAVLLAVTWLIGMACGILIPLKGKRSKEK